MEWWNDFLIHTIQYQLKPLFKMKTDLIDFLSYYKVIAHSLYPMFVISLNLKMAPQRLTARKYSQRFYEIYQEINTSYAHMSQDVASAEVVTYQ